MKVSPPTLAPFLRSDAQGLLLAELYLHSEVEVSVSSLAKAGGMSIASAMREVDRLVGAGFATERKVGQTRLVRVNSNHPTFAPMQFLVLYGYGPVLVLRELLAGRAGIAEAYIFGSWAERIRGTAGPDPADIDVLCIGSISSRDAFAIAKEAMERLHREVNVHNLSADEWTKADSGFVKTVKSKPLVRIELA
jgi:DNA-binding transcriptional ArsR family regulator